jgi:hypothetical protein
MVIIMKKFGLKHVRSFQHAKLKVKINMKQPKPSDDYGHGQMMGMLVIIQLLENSREVNIPVPSSTFETIKKIAVNDLAGYLEKPEEDIFLLVDQQLKKV